jgi:DNA modification methylase
MEIKVHCKYDELIHPRIAKDRFHKKNPNMHTDEQIERLVKILKYQGWRYPVKISNLSGQITSGHGRVMAALKLDCTVPVVFQDYEDEDQEYADIVSDNSIASWSELDLSLINMEIPNFDPNFDIELLGLKDFAIEPADKYADQDADAIPEKVDTISKPGDLWILGEHKLLCGDSTKREDVERLMAGKKASLWCSDPPYGINYVEVTNKKRSDKCYSTIKNDKLQDEALQKFIFEAISNSLPHMKENFAFYMWHAMKMQSYFAAAAAEAAGILFHRQIIWRKPQLVFGRGQYHWRHELCLMGWLQGNECPFYGERNQDTVWEIGRENDKIHPTQKPVEIYLKPITNHTKAGEIVYEPFAGSGTGYIAAEKTGRKCFGLELSPEYCDVIVARWENFTAKKAVLEKL